MSSSVRLVRVLPWEVPYYWEFVEKELSRAVAHNNGESGMDDLWRMLVTGHQTLWVVWNEERQEIACCFTTFVQQYDKKRSLFVCLLAGKGMREFFHLGDELAEYAKSIGCSAIESLVIPRVAALVQKLSPKHKITHQKLVREL